MTIVADSSMAADALSTILFVAGIKKGLSLLERFNGAEAIIIDGPAGSYYGWLEGMLSGQ